MGNVFTANVDSLLQLSSQVAGVLFTIYVVILTLQTIIRRGIVYATIQLLSFRVLLPLFFVVTLSLASLAVVFVQPTQIGVVISVLSPGGVRASPLPAGLNFIVPLLEEVEVYPIYWQNYTMSAKLGEGNEYGDDSIRARTRDGQEVLLDVSLIFRIDRAQAVLVHIDWQNRYIEDLVRPLLRGYVRTQVSQFTVEEVNSAQRRDLEALLDRLLREEMGSKGFIVDQFLLRDVTFSPEYAAAVEAKQVALEEQEAALFEAERERRLARGLADAVEIEAQGQARAIEIEAQAQANAFREIGEALSENRDSLLYYYIDRLAPNIRALLLPSNNPLLLPLPELNEIAEPVPTAQATPAPEATSEAGS